SSGVAIRCRSFIGLLALGLATQTVWAHAQAPGQAAAVANGSALLQEGMALYDGAKYAEAVVSFGRAIDALSPSDAAQRDVLVKAYEYRARARYVIRD